MRYAFFGPRHLTVSNSLRCARSGTRISERHCTIVWKSSTEGIGTRNIIKLSEHRCHWMSTTEKLLEQVECIVQTCRPTTAPKHCEWISKASEEIRWCPLGIKHAGLFSEPIVRGSFLRIGQNFIGFRNALELFLCFFTIRWILIGMILQRKTPVRSLDFVSGASLRELESCIMVVGHFLEMHFSVEPHAGCIYNYSLLISVFLGFPPLVV